MTEYCPTYMSDPTVVCTLESDRLLFIVHLYAPVVRLDREAIDRWVAKGAQVSPRVESLMKDAAAQAAA